MLWDPSAEKILEVQGPDFFITDPKHWLSGFSCEVLDWSHESEIFVAF